MAVSSGNSGFRTKGEKDSPGGGYKRNMNLDPRGKLPLAPRFRSIHSRSKSRTSR